MYTQNRQGSNNSSRKPFRSGKFNKQKRFYSDPHNVHSRSNRFSSGGNRRRSKLIGLDVNIFIKKSKDISEDLEYTPQNSFSDFNLIEPLKQNILKKGFSHPTPIQDQAIKPILEGRDLVGHANTGTGKTAAFLIPVINTIFKDRTKKVLVIAPTRELALQINEEFRKLAWDMKIYSTLIIGGANIRRQINDLRRNIQVVIGTPGRIKDLIGQRQLYIEDFNIFVLDEVDLMLDIGFIADIKYFISLLPQNRQSLFFSATISWKIREIIDTFVNNPVTVSVKQQDTSENIDQNIVKIVNKEKKVDQLHDLLIQEGFDKVLVFGETKHGIEKLNKELDSRGFKVGSIHGNKNQSQRQRTLERFKTNQIQILLATDVASRGLDIDNVTHVINYDLPETYEDYIHRIGRTGRANRKGFALTFVE